MSRGFTLIEVLTTLAIASLALVTIAEGVMYMYRSNSSTIEQGMQVASARNGVSQFTRDAREAAYADTGAYPIAAIGTSSISFYADTDRDQSVELVRYTLIGTSLIRTVVEAGSPPTYLGPTATSVVSQHVRNIEDGVPLFRYYTKGLEVAATSSVSRIDAVSITPIVDIFTQHLPLNVTLSETAAFRNVRTP